MWTDDRVKRRIRTGTEWNPEQFNRTNDDDSYISHLTWNSDETHPIAKRRSNRSRCFLFLWAGAALIWIILTYSPFALPMIKVWTTSSRLGIPMSTQFQIQTSEIVTFADTSLSTITQREQGNIQILDSAIVQYPKDNLVAQTLGIVETDNVSTPKRLDPKSPERFLSKTLQQCSTLLKDPTLLQEMIYWDNTQPKDYAFKAPTMDTLKYLTFEPDTGGWNSQHMVLETMVVLALSLGRTLVLPPKQGMPNGSLLSYEDFIELKSSLENKYKGIKIVTTEVFLKHVAVKGHLRQDGKVLRPPGNRIRWDNTPDIGRLYQYLRTVSHIPREWDPQTCLLGIPLPGQNTTKLHKALEGIWKMEDSRPPPFHLDFQGKPTPVNAPLVERLREFVADRKIACTYQGPMKDATTLHIPTTSDGKSLLFAPFYSFIFFEDYQQDLLMKRMVRNELRYKDDIICTASRIVDSLRALSGGTFHAFHIRGAAYENAHHDVHEDAPWILREIREWIPKNSTVFVSTDEADRSFFAALSKEYHLYFASDFSILMKGLTPGYLEVVQQLVCARSGIFIGTFYSSFSGFVNRMRGYYSTREHGNDLGTLDSYYHSPANMKKEMRIYRSIRKPFYIREFPTAWRDIDRIR